MKATVRTNVALSVVACLALASTACEQGATNNTQAAADNTANSVGAAGPGGSNEQADTSNATTAAPAMTDEQRTAYLTRHGEGFGGTDTNSDGRVTMEEANAYARRPLTLGGDTDGDGAMSAAELAQANPAVRAQLLRRDADGDGAVSSAEIDSRVQTTFRATDTDGDGGISQQEWDAATRGAPAR